MKYFTRFIIVLAIILIAVTLLISSTMGVFIVSIASCLWLERIDRKRDNIKPYKEGEA